MSRRSDAAGGRGRRRALALATVVPVALVAAPLGADAQQGAPPRPPARDTTVRGDTLPRPGQGRTSPGLDTLRADSPARDGRRSAADSAARDSLVAQQRRARAGDASYAAAFVDRLRLSAVGASFGAAWPTRVVSARLVSVQADYGEVVPGLRLGFGLSYWNSRYTDAARRELERAVRGVVTDPTNDAEVRVPPVTASDLVFGTEVRWRPAAFTAPYGPVGRVRPFVTGGLALHFPNAQGAPISGTFVEQAMDGIALGGSAGAGVDLHVLPNFLLSMLARYDLFNGAHFPSLRAGLSYVLDPGSMRLPPRTRPRGRGAAAAAGAPDPSTHEESQ